MEKIFKRITASQFRILMIFSTLMVFTACQNQKTPENKLDSSNAGDLFGNNTPIINDIFNEGIKEVLKGLPNIEAKFKSNENSVNLGVLTVSKSFVEASIPDKISIKLSKDLVLKGKKKDKNAAMPEFLTNGLSFDDFKKTSADGGITYDFSNMDQQNRTLNKLFSSLLGEGATNELSKHKFFKQFKEGISYKKYYERIKKNIGFTGTLKNDEKVWYNILKNLADNEFFSFKIIQTKQDIELSINIKLKTQKSIQELKNLFIEKTQKLDQVFQTLVEKAKASWTAENKTGFKLDAKRFLIKLDAKDREALSKLVSTINESDFVKYFESYMKDDWGSFIAKLGDPDFVKELWKELIDKIAEMKDVGVENSLMHALKGMFSGLTAEDIKNLVVGEMPNWMDAKDINGMFIAPKWHMEVLNSLFEKINSGIENVDYYILLKDADADNEKNLGNVKNQFVFSLDIPNIDTIFTGNTPDSNFSEFLENIVKEKFYNADKKKFTVKVVPSDVTNRKAYQNDLDNIDEYGMATFDMAGADANKIIIDKTASVEISVEKEADKVKIIFDYPGFVESLNMPQHRVYTRSFVYGMIDLNSFITRMGFRKDGTFIKESPTVISQRPTIEKMCQAGDTTLDDICLVHNKLKKNTAEFPNGLDDIITLPLLEAEGKEIIMDEVIISQIIINEAKYTEAQTYLEGLGKEGALSLEILKTSKEAAEKAAFKREEEERFEREEIEKLERLEREEEERFERERLYRLERLERERLERLEREERERLEREERERLEREEIERERLEREERERLERLERFEREEEERERLEREEEERERLEREEEERFEREEIERLGREKREKAVIEEEKPLSKKKKKSSKKKLSKEE